MGVIAPRVGFSGQAVRDVIHAFDAQSLAVLQRGAPHNIEPKWLAGKKRVVEPARLLSADELAERVCTAYACPHHPHLVAPHKDAPVEIAAKKDALSPRAAKKAA